MNSFAGTQTERNLVNAFTGSERAVCSDSIFAHEAKDSGYERTASMFLKHMYDSYAQTAMEEGFPEVAKTFRLFSEIERNHSHKAQVLLKSIVMADVLYESC